MADANGVGISWDNSAKADGVGDDGEPGMAKDGKVDIVEISTNY